ncbi:MAG: PAS domain S-box protein, partial [Ekhidna sp.]
NVQAVFWEAEIGSLGFSYISPKAVEMFGYPISSWMKDRFWESIIFEEDREKIVSLERGGTKFSSKNYDLEYRMVKSDGAIVWVKDLVEVVKSDSGINKLRGLLVNITDQKNTEQKLKSSEARYKELIKEAPYAITIYNKKGILIAANEKCNEIWLLDKDKWIGKYNIFQEQEFKDQGLKKSIKEAFEGQKNESSSELIIPMSGGIKKHLHIKYYPLFDDRGIVENVVFISEDVTEYVQAEEKAKTGEALKQGILDALDDGILVIDKEGVIISLNKSLSTYVSNQTYPLPVGKSIYDFFYHLGDQETLISGLDSILSKKSSFFDHEIKLADGRWYGMKMTPLETPFGAVISWQNINTRKEIELALEKSLRKYKSIYNTAPVMMHSIDFDRKIVSVSDFWLGKMGYDRKEVIGKSPSTFMTEESKKRFLVNVENLFKNGSLTNANYQFIKKSGSIMDVILSASIEYDDQGKFERSITGITDITELKAIERELVDSQMNLLESQRLSKIGNYEFYTKSGKFISSSEMDVMMGFESSDDDISILENLVVESDLPSLLGKLEVSLKTGRDFFHVYRIAHLQTGNIKWISGRGKTVADEGGEIVKMIGTVQDITEQKTAEEKIRRLTDRILLATEIAGIGVWEYDRGTDETFWEEQMYEVFGSRKEPITDPSEMLAMLHEDDKNVLQDAFQEIKKGANFLEVECRVCVDSSEKYLRSFTRVIRDQDGHVLGLIGVFYDNTHDKALQIKLENSLDEKNILIKEVHHRVKNNMQLVSSILALKSYELRDENSKKVFAEVNNRIKAMSIIHDKLYTFFNVSEINIAEYLNSISEELRILFGSEYIQLKVDAEEVIFDVDKALTIGLIISELVSNAFKHGFETVKKGTINISFKKTGTKYCLTILNDGNLIPSNALESTSGLGMSLIKTFAKQLSGNVTVDDRNGFKVDFGKKENNPS